jgi:thioredoxin 1
VNSNYYPGMEFEVVETDEHLDTKKDTSSSDSKQSGDSKMSVIKINDFAAFQDTVSKESNVLVKFEADWCMPCKAMSSVVEEIAKQHPDVKVLAVDIEAEGMDDILIEYGVRSLPTFVHLREGEKVNSACGTITKAELSSFLNLK